MQIELLSDADVEWMAPLHERIFKKTIDLKGIISNPTTIMLGIKEKAYLIVTRVAPESEIIFIAVDEKHRRQSIARAMLSEYINNYKGDIFLEVEEGNLPAIGLYNSAGFTEYGRRKNYYGHKDAVLMRRINADISDRDELR